MNTPLPALDLQPEQPAPAPGDDAPRAALAECEARLQALLRQQDVFAHGISHDLRAPLRAIENFSALLDSHAADALDLDARRYLKRIRDAAERMGALIEALLDYSRVDRIELSPEPVDLGLLAGLALAELQEAEPARKLHATIGAGLEVLGDERQLRMLVTQLLRNAWIFSGDDVVVDVSGQHRGDMLRIAVRDQGSGFDMRYATKLFEPFQRLHAPEQGAGHGIGLAIAQRIVERHRGRLWAQSEPGAGSTFFLELPTPRPTS